MESSRKIVIILLICIVGVILITTMSNFKQTNSTSDTGSTDTVMIFYAPWCGHCKRSMSDFQDARDQSNGKIILINSEEPESKELLIKYGIKGFPTIRKKSGLEYNGPRSSKDIIEFAES